MHKFKEQLALDVSFVNDVIIFSALQTVSRLLGCDAQDLKLALCTRKMRVRNDTIIQKLTLAQVMIFYIQ